MNIYISKGKLVMSFLFMLMASTYLFISCSDDDDKKGEPPFKIEGDLMGFLADNKATESKTEPVFVVRSNRSWKIEVRDGDWAKVFPTEGDADGKFKLTIKENVLTEPRVMNLAFIVDGKEEPNLFRLEQKASPTFIRVEGGEKVSVPVEGGAITLKIEANVIWKHELAQNDWIKIDAVTSTEIKLTALNNEGSQRTVELTLADDAKKTITKVSLVQIANTVVLKEDFSWLAYGNAIPYVTGGELRYDLWTPEQQAKGWTTTVNSVTGSGNTPLLYARQGFVKLGKTGYGGDLISPKMAKIVGTVNLKVIFKAAGYVSEGGALDTDLLIIEILGPGTTSVSSMNVDNFPNNKAQDAAGVVNDIWEGGRIKSFVITGATADTQFKFLGGGYALSGGKNRIFLDNITAEIIE